MTLIRESAELNRRERDKIEYLTPGSPVNYSLLSTGVIAGDSIKVINGGTATVTVLSSNASTIFAIPPGAEAVFVSLVSSPTTAANWKRNAISGVIGDTSGTAVPANYIGERLFASRLRSASFAMSSGVAADTTTAITLGAGVWTISGAFGMRTLGANLVLTRNLGAISAVSNTLPASADTTAVPNSVGEFSVYVEKSDTYLLGGDVVIPIPAYTVVLSAPSTLRLVQRLDSSNGSPNSYGFIQAVRIA